MKTIYAVCGRYKDSQFFPTDENMFRWFEDRSDAEDHAKELERDMPFSERLQYTEFYVKEIELR